MLHVALRNFDEFKIEESGVNEIADVLNYMREFSESVRNGAWKGYTGKTIDTMVNIGISGYTCRFAMVYRGIMVHQIDYIVR